MAREEILEDRAWRTGVTVPGTKYWDRVPPEQREYWMHDCCEPDCPDVGSFHPINDFTSWRCYDHWMRYQQEGERHGG